MYIYIFSSSFFSFHYLFCYLFLRWQRFSCLSFSSQMNPEQNTSTPCGAAAVWRPSFFFLIFLCIILAADGRIYSVMRRQCIRCGNPIWRDAPVLHFYSVIPLVYYRAYPSSHSTQLGDFRWSENGCLIFLIFSCVRWVEYWNGLWELILLLLDVYKPFKKRSTYDIKKREKEYNGCIHSVTSKFSKRKARL